MGEGQFHVLAKQGSMRLRKRRVQEQAGQARKIYVCQNLCGFHGEETGGDQDIELLAPVEFEDDADAVEDFATDAAITRFQATQGAVVDVGEPRDLILGQTAFGAELDQQATQIFAGTR